MERSVRFLLGCGLIIHEAIIRQNAQPYVLACALGLLGLPDMLRLDRWLDRQTKDDGQGQGP